MAHQMNEFHFQRSAIEPVGMVAVVSMKATMYRKKPATAAPPAEPMSVRANPPFQTKTQSPKLTSASPTGAPYPKSAPGRT